MHKLFFVEGWYSNRDISAFANFGDDYGETYSWSELVVAVSPEEAVSQAWDKMQARVDDVRTKAKKIHAQVEALERKGKTGEAEALMERATSPFAGIFPFFSPSCPRDRKKWRASEVLVPGWRIIVEPDNATPKSRVPQSQKTLGRAWFLKLKQILLPTNWIK